MRTRSGQVNVYNRHTLSVLLSHLSTCPRPTITAGKPCWSSVAYSRSSPACSMPGLLRSRSERGCAPAPGETGLRLLAALARRPLWLLAMALSAVAWVGEAASLALAPVPVVATLRNAGRGLLVVGGGRWLDEHFSRLELVGRRPGQRRRRSSPRPAPPHSRVARRPLSNLDRACRGATCLLAAGLVVLVLLPAGRRQPARAPAAGCGRSDGGRRRASFCRHGCVHQGDRRPFRRLRGRGPAAVLPSAGALADGGHGGLVAKPRYSTPSGGPTPPPSRRPTRRRLARPHRRRLRPLRPGRARRCQRRACCSGASSSPWSARPSSSAPARPRRRGSRGSSRPSGAA